jgi:hypothetical protein
MARFISAYTWMNPAAPYEFHWIAGLRDVPDEDVQRELTVQAPTPPLPAPAHDEPPEPQPTPTAVWTPGSWQWDGRAYVWIAGTWRIPPGTLAVTLGGEVRIIRAREGEATSPVHPDHTVRRSHRRSG